MKAYKLSTPSLLCGVLGILILIGLILTIVSIGFDGGVPIILTFLGLAGVGLVGSLLGIVFGALTISKANRSVGTGGKGRGVSGLVCGIVGVIGILAASITVLEEVL